MLLALARCGIRRAGSARQFANVSRGCVMPSPLPLLSRRLLRCSAAARVETLDTPFLSDSVPLAEGILGTVEELHLEVGSAVKEDDVIAVIDMAKVSLDVKASKSGVVAEVLVNVGEEVKEASPLYRLEEKE
mmetsp:Transcript_701/g.1422  ORF Transcript_701/g.1422 Transcript_701/m.1422 type:complete len:132 (+) Transcript_701:384-779(+)